MFAADVYAKRRAQLAQQCGSGVLLFLGNTHCPMNYLHNTFPFYQDSSFLYYWGLNRPDLAAIIDLDQGVEYLIGDAQSTQEMIFCGAQKPLVEVAAQVAVQQVIDWSECAALLSKAQAGARQLHYLAPYQAQHELYLRRTLGIAQSVSLEPSAVLTQAVIAQRMLKSTAEIEQMQQAIDLSADNHSLAMRETAVGRYEHEVVASMQAYAIKQQSSFAYPIIFSVRGEVLHNNLYHNQMQSGQIVLHDSGLNSALRYASDITRSFPVNGKFSQQQAEIYQLVYDMQQAVFKKLKPGVLYRDCHLEAARVAVQGLQQLGLMQGDVDEAVTSGAYALFFPHGIGHPIGLDVHDMEALGEAAVGYDAQLQRSAQFGLSALRFGRALAADMVMTVEPGIYFIPALIKAWQAEEKFSDFICYQALVPYLDFGGVRIEDNVLITADGHVNLSQKIPSRLKDVEQACANH